MYLRFVVSELDEDSNSELGVFLAIGNLREAGKLHSYEELHHDVIKQWFNEIWKSLVGSPALNLLSIAERTEPYPGSKTAR
jgi:hypothetical protein